MGGHRRKRTITFNTSLLTSWRQPSQAGDLFTIGQRTNTLIMHDNQYGTVIPSHTLFYCLTNFLPGRCSTGPEIPGVVSHESRYHWTTSLPPGWPVRSHRALPECRYLPKLAPTDTPESHDYSRHPPAGYSQTALSAHSLTIACLQLCPGFHSTAVLNVWAFTVLLFYSSPNYAQTGIPMDLPIYPPNTIPQHLYTYSNNTFYWVNK